MTEDETDELHTTQFISVLTHVGKFGLTMRLRIWLSIADGIWVHSGGRDSFCVKNKQERNNNQWNGLQLSRRGKLDTVAILLHPFIVPLTIELNEYALIVHLVVVPKELDIIECLQITSWCDLGLFHIADASPEASEASMNKRRASRQPLHLSKAQEWPGSEHNPKGKWAEQSHTLKLIIEA